MVETIDSEWLKIEFLGIQRWENEGGQIIEGNNNRIFTPRTAPRHVTSLQWNERIVIEPHRPGIGMILISENHAE